MESGSKLWGHQIESIKFALSHKNVMIASGMGSGKTRIALEVVKIEKYKRILVVVPKKVLTGNVWPIQIRKYVSENANVYSAVSGTADDKGKRLRGMLQVNRHVTDPIFVLVNYDSMWRGDLGEAIIATDWDCIILDEAHKIRAAGSKVSVFAKRLGSRPNTKKKMALTGTPTPNSPLDVYGSYRFLESSIFGTRYDTFKNRYAIFGGFNNFQVLRYINLEELRDKVASISVRYKTEDVIDLPPTLDTFFECDLNEETRRVYDSLEKEFVAEIGDGHITAKNALVKALRMRQVVGGVIKSDDGVVRVLGGDKLALLDEVIESIPAEIRPESPSGLGREPTVVFCEFVSDMFLVRRELDKNGITNGELSGSKDDYADWVSGKYEFLVVQISTGSEGIDLTRACYAIYYTPCWSLGVYEQSRARLHRPGQTRTTRFFHLVANCTIEGAIYRAIQSKRNVVEYVLQAMVGVVP